MPTRETAPAVDRITEIRIDGARSIAKLRLKLEGLTVLIGPNGAGKSTILEALQLLHGCAQAGSIERRIYTEHGGLRSILRHGESSLRLGLTAEGAGEPITYDVHLSGGQGGFSIDKERLVLGPKPGDTHALEVIRRSTTSKPQFLDPATSELVPIPHIAPTALAIHSFGVFAPHAAIDRLIAVLDGVSVHVPFEVRPAWSNPQALPALRASNVVRPSERLERFGANLANVWLRLKNDFGREAFDAAMHDVRAGLGPEIEDVGTQADLSGGAVALKLRFADGTDVPAFSISDGMLAYLAFVALRHLPDPKRSLLAFDEPELHLHPDLVVRTVGLFETIASQSPVILATHSDQLLDALGDPVRSAVLCDLGPDRTTRLRRPSRQALNAWLEDYRGLGALRAEGYDASVFTEPADAPVERVDDGGEEPEG